MARGDRVEYCTGAPVSPTNAKAETFEEVQVPHSPSPYPWEVRGEGSA